jgi:hypothetical protein
VARERSESQTAVSISLSKEALGKIDARAASLGLNRSAYLNLVAQQDVTKGGPLPPVTTMPGQALQPFDLTTEVYDFLLIAIPTLQAYEARRDGKAPPSEATVEIPPEFEESRLWRFFRLEREEILRHKYLRSRELGYDIGLPQAVKEWLHLHRALWAREHPPAD